MEIFKNLHDRVNLFIMLVLMCLNIIGGLIISNQSWMRTPGTFVETMLWLFGFSVFGTFVFLFVYPYQLARTEYKNKVMSLMIASGVSRVQYYFVKVGATLLFSFISFTLLAILPTVIVLISTGGLEFAVTDTHYIEITEVGEILVTFGILIVGWLSSFVTLMTSVIIAKGRAFTIFVFVGILFASSQATRIIRGLFGTPLWQMNNTMILIQNLIVMLVIGLIGILILRKQDL